MDVLPDLVDERQSWLMDRLRRDGRVTTATAAADLGVSVDTVRRDLRAMHERGLLRRVHGGAVAPARLPASYAGRTAESAASRSALAAAVVDRLRPGQVVGLDAGSTCVQIAAAVPPSLPLTVVTNSPPAAVALTDHPAVQVVLLGGAVDLTWMATVGAEAVDGWRGVNLDVGVVGVCGLDPDGDATTNSPAEVATKRALIASAAEVVVPLQAEKADVRGPFVVAPATRIDTLVVEALIDGAFAERCAAAGLDVVTAGGAG